MPEDVENQDSSNLAQELDAKLNSLDQALAEATESVDDIRGKLAHFAALADVVHEMEAAMSRARVNLGKSEGLAPPPRSAPPLRAVPPQPTPDPQPLGQAPPTPPVPTPAIEPPASAPAPDASPTPAPSAAEPPPSAPAPEVSATPEPSAIETPPSAPAPEVSATPEPSAIEPPPQVASAEPQPAKEAAPAQSETKETVSHCLRLGVSSKTGSLDLKAVDGSVSENPAVVDVALLDYDGRQATLKLWINNAADPNGVRDSLYASLRRRLGDERDADVQIDFEEGSAA